MDRKGVCVCVCVYMCDWMRMCERVRSDCGVKDRTTHSHTHTHTHTTPHTHTAFIIHTQNERTRRRNQTSVAMFRE